MSLSRLTNPTIWLDGNLKDILTSVKSSLIYILSAYFHNQLWSSPSSPRRVEGSLYFSQDKASHRTLLGDSSGFSSLSPEQKCVGSNFGFSSSSCKVIAVMIVVVVMIVMIVFIVTIVTIAPCHRWQSSRSTCSIPPTWTPPVVCHHHHFLSVMIFLKAHYGHYLHLSLPDIPPRCNALSAPSTISSWSRSPLRCTCTKIITLKSFKSDIDI